MLMALWWCCMVGIESYERRNSGRQSTEVTQARTCFLVSLPLSHQPCLLYYFLTERALTIQICPIAVPSKCLAPLSLLAFFLCDIKDNCQPQITLTQYTQRRSLRILRSKNWQKRKSWIKYLGKSLSFCFSYIVSAFPYMPVPLFSLPTADSSSMVHSPNPNNWLC